MKTKLHDRINRVINTCAFEKALEAGGACLFEFQVDWLEYDSFEELPKAYQDAIVAGEAELSKTGVLEIA